jgi:hypothetical protein
MLRDEIGRGTVSRGGTRRSGTFGSCRGAAGGADGGGKQGLELILR